ncbi:MAG: endonuclease/exonuclease/phosphatase family protein, partial [Vicinamibacterales bacterium]
PQAAIPARIAGVSTPYRWTAPSTAGERQKLDAWCESAGPPVIADPPAVSSATPVRQESPANELVVVTWNVHAGTGDVAELVSRLRGGTFTKGRPVTRFVLLLQEAMRSGTAVPTVVAAGVKSPRAAGRGGPQSDIVTVARELGLFLFYVPSMRNGSPSDTDQDRGNAILSTDALTEFTAIELPFERQRRVAVAATLSGDGGVGAGWRLRVVSAHLESTVPASRLWVLAHGARVRQAKALVDAIGAIPAVVLSGDFNTWFGFSDPAYRAIDAAIPGAAERERRPTYGPFFRLDHVFARVPDEWTVAASRLPDRLGSDHYPILASLRHASSTDRAHVN